MAVITRARTPPAPSSVSAARASVWTRTDAPVNVSYTNQMKCCCLGPQHHHTPCGHPGNLLLSLSVCLSLSLSLSYSAALGNTVEALSSGSQDIVGTLAQPQLALLQDYNQPLERYDDYEDDDAGELLAESMLAEKFGEPLNTNTHTMVLYLISSVSEQQEVNRKTSLFNY